MTTTQKRPAWATSVATGFLIGAFAALISGIGVLAGGGAVAIFGAGLGFVGVTIALFGGFGYFMERKN